MSSVELYVPTWIYLIDIILIAAGIVCSVGSWVFVFYYRKKPIVAMGQPTFLYSLCFGALLLPIAIAFGLAVSFFDSNNDDENNGTIIPVNSKTSSGTIFNVCCNFVAWLHYIGIIVIYTALLCKIYRIMKLTQQPLRRGLKILPRHVLWPFILVVSFTVGLLIAWSATGSSKYAIGENLEEKTNNNTTTISGGYCAVSPSLPTATISPSRQIVIALIVLVTIVQFVLIILAWKIRKINQELGDSKRILRMVVFQFILNIICTSTASSNGHEVSLLIYSINFVITSISTIGFMILPRMYYVWYEHQYGHLPENVVMIGSGGTTTTVRGVKNQNTGNNSAGGTGVTPSPRHTVRNNDNNNNIKDDDGVIEIAC